VFNQFPSLKGRGGFGSLLVFAAVFAAWVAVHWFGPSSGNPQSQMVYLAAIIVVGTFVAGAALAFITILIKSARNR
jgi:hypothetical protein